MLCAENGQDVAERMRQLLDGKHFTFVHANSYDEDSDRFSAIDVRTSEWCNRLPEADVDDGYVRVHWGTCSYSCSVGTSAKTEAEGREGNPHDFVAVRFEWDRMVIDHYAPARYKLQWALVVEDPARWVDDQ